MNMKKPGLSVLLWCMMAALAGCTAALQASRNEFVTAHSELTAQQKETILKGEISAGMSQDMVIASWGKPAEKAKEIIEGKEIISWVYLKTVRDLVSTYLVQFAGGLVSEVKLVNVQKTCPPYEFDYVAPGYFPAIIHHHR